MKGISRETAAFLLTLLQSQTLNVGAPDFAETLARVVAALAELRAILEEPAPLEVQPNDHQR